MQHKGLGPGLSRLPRYEDSPRWLRASCQALPLGPHAEGPAQGTSWARQAEPQKEPGEAHELSLTPFTLCADSAGTQGWGPSPESPGELMRQTAVGLG